MECRYCILERTYFTFPCFLVIETEADLYENDSVIGAYDEIYFVSGNSTIKPGIRPWIKASA